MLSEHMKDQLYTSNALQANRVAAMFRAAFAQKKVGDHTVDISEPDESTQKGVLALQHVTLKGPTGLGLVVGSVNTITRVAELRPYAAVVRMHEQRFKLPPGFDAVMYSSFVDDATATLTEQGLRVGTMGADDDLETSSIAPGARLSPSRTMLVIAVTIGIAVGAAAMWLIR